MTDTEFKSRGVGPAGVPAEAFAAVGEFVDTVLAAGEIGDNGEIGGSHPLILLAESVLEAFSNNCLDTDIAGLHKRSMEQLTEYRRSLEFKDPDSAELQDTIQTFEQVCDDARGSLYGSASSASTASFFGSSFPEWLEQMANWAEFNSDVELVTALRSAIERYNELPMGWWA